MGLILGRTVGFQVVKLGAGGQLTGLDVAPDGRVVVRTDVGGGYLWKNDGSNKWLPLFTNTNVGDAAGNTSGGLIEVKFAYSNSQRIYANRNGYTYRRDNDDGDWVQCAFPKLANSDFNTGVVDSNGSYKFANNKFAVDPNNADVIFVMTNNNGLLRSDDAGATYATVSGVTASTDVSGGLAFDASSGTTTVSGKTVTSRIIVPSKGNGVWESTDGGQNWTQIADGSSNASPLNVFKGVMTSDGVYLCYDNTSPLQGVWRYKSGVWDKIKTGAVGAICPYPTDVGRLLLADFGSGGKNGNVSLDYNASTVSFFSGGPWFATYPANINNIADDIPWLETQDTGYMTVGDMMVDPTVDVVKVTGTTTNGSPTVSSLSSTDDLEVGQFVCGPGIPAKATIASIDTGASSLTLSANATASATVTLTCNFANVWFAEGIGMWKGNWPNTFTAFDWYSHSAGIEEFVANDVIAPLGGKASFSVWDRSVLSRANSELVTYPSDLYPPPATFSAGWGLDYASSDPSFVCCCSNWGSTTRNGYSEDGGYNWQQYAGVPPSINQGGCIAASTPDNQVICHGNNANPCYTEDQGKDWATCEDLPTTAGSWIYAYYINAKPICADRVAANTFYADCASPTSSERGIWKSTNGGKNWTQVYVGAVAANWGSQRRLAAVPGYEGYLLWRGYHGGDGAAVGIKLSMDGGETWGALGADLITNITDFGFGKAAQGSDYPTIFAHGTVGGIASVYRSIDFGQTWVDQGMPDIADTPTCISGDMNIFGRFYLGFAGSGFSYYDA